VQYCLFDESHFAGWDWDISSYPLSLSLSNNTASHFASCEFNSFQVPRLILEWIDALSLVKNKTMQPNFKQVIVTLHLLPIDMT
jgi:hypothetical protein